MRNILLKFGFTRNFLWYSFTLLLFFFFVFFLHVVMVPEIALVGGENIVLEYQDSYQEFGYRATHLGKDVTEDVLVVGKVNSKKLGKYSISYQVGEGIFSKKIVRKIEVVDSKKPKIHMDSKDIYVCPGKKYQLEPVQADDNYDGDLTSKVHGSIHGNQVVYSVKDSSGNESKVTKKLLYEDHEKPVVTLKGDSVVELCTNDVYKDPGYQAIDNCDQDLTKQVEVLGSVDTSLVGDYDISYKVSDQAGNEGIANRKVRVSHHDTNGVVYLTFDDGPKEGTTDVILDILKEEGVEATFFVTNSGPDALIEREYLEGHTVGLHTSSHNYATVYASDDAYFDDLNQVSDRVLRITGEKSMVIRFPGGSSNTVSRRYSSGIMSRLTREVVHQGYRYYDWNISSGDAGETTDPNEVYSNVVHSLRKDRVNMVLMHDIKPYTRDALRRIIRYCKENGYPIKKITGCTTLVQQRVNN